MKIKRIQDWFPVVHYHCWELFLFRLFFAWILWETIPANPLSYDSAPHPNGFALIFPVAIFHNPEVLSWARNLALVGLFFYVIGRLQWLALPVITVACLSPAALGNSQGSAHHNLQLVHMALAVTTIWYVGVALRNLLGRKLQVNRLERSEALNLEAHFIKQAIAAGYVVSAITKLINSHGAWIYQARNFGLQIRKTSGMYHHNFGTTPAESVSWIEQIPRYLEQLILDYPWTGSWILAPGLIIELFVFLALIGRRSAFITGLCLVFLHFSIGKIMHLQFRANVMMITLYFLNFPFLIYWLKQHLLSAKETSKSAAQ